MLLKHTYMRNEMTKAEVLLYHRHHVLDQKLNVVPHLSHRYISGEHTPLGLR